MGWEKILDLQYNNWADDENKVQTKNNCLRWLDRVESSMRESWSIVQKIWFTVSDEDKARVEALSTDEEFSTLMEVKHDSFQGWSRGNHA